MNSVSGVPLYTLGIYSEASLTTPIISIAGRSPQPVVINNDSMQGRPGCGATSPGGGVGRGGGSRWGSVMSSTHQSRPACIPHSHDCHFPGRPPAAGTGSVPTCRMQSSRREAVGRRRGRTAGTDSRRRVQRPGRSDLVLDGGRPRLDPLALRRAHRIAAPAHRTGHRTGPPSRRLLPCRDTPAPPQSRDNGPLGSQRQHSAVGDSNRADTLWYFIARLDITVSGGYRLQRGRPTAGHCLFGLPLSGSEDLRTTD